MIDFVHDAGATACRYPGSDEACDRDDHWHCTRADVVGAVDRLTRERDTIAERVKNYLVGDCYICHHDAEIQGICSRCHDCLPCRLSKLEAACAALRLQKDAYRLAAATIHDGLVGHLNAGAYCADLAQEGIRLFDEAEAREGHGHPDDIAAARSYQTRCEELEAELAALRRERDQLKEALEARHASKAVGDPDYCQGCGGRYRFDTTISSERWNAVIRENGLPEYLCSACILREFAKRGLGFTATLWGAEFNGESIQVSVSPPERREPT